MKNKYKRLTYGTSSLLLLAGFVSCGDVNETQRTYSATLTSVNKVIAPVTVGNSTINIEKDNLTATLNLSLAPVGTHRQGIMTGTACPTEQDDTNGDGFVDAVEAQAVSGKTLIPLDGDLSSQNAGADTYPADDYTYTQTASFAQMVSDLVTPDDNPNDSIVKLTTADELTFQGKVVMVFGVPASTVLPPTVQSIDGLPAQATLPLVCGVYKNDSGNGGSTTGGTGTTTGETGTTTGGDTGTTTGGATGTTTGETGTTTGETTGGTTGLI